MSMLLPLANFAFDPPPEPAKTLGRKGVERWISLSKLRIDDSYQRPIDAAGRKTIRGIIENFRWHKFAPLVVASRPGGLYAVVDGQHRAVACALHGGVKEVPCHVLACSEEEEAAAFATINGIVTRMHPQYLFRARIAAGDAGAVGANNAAKAAGVTIMAYPVAASLLKVGETLAGRTIELELARVGRPALVAALELITRTGAGNAGLIKAALIEGFCDVYATHPKWLTAEPECRRVVHRRTVKQIFADAIQHQAARQCTMRAAVAEILASSLQEALGDGGKTVNPLEVRRAVKRNESRKGLIPAAFAKKAVAPPRAGHGGNVGALTKTDMRHHPVPDKRQKAQVSTDEKTLIAEHLKKHGARRFETRDTGDEWQLSEWLKRKGFDVVRNTGANKPRYAFKINGKPYNREEFFAFINKQRAKDKLPALQRAS